MGAAVESILATHGVRKELRVKYYLGERHELRHSKVSKVSMPGFTPANSDHAITGVTFILEFNRSAEVGAVSKLSQAKVQAELPWIEALPAVTSIPAMSVGVGPAGQVLSQYQCTQFAYVRPNGQPIWLMRIGVDEIRVECSQYTRWAKIWGAAETYLGQAFSQLRSEDTGLCVNRITLQVTDKFVGAAAGYDLSLLIRDQRMLGRVPFENGDLWHVFLGWFENESWGSVLNNLNVQASGEGKVEAPVPIATEPFFVSVLHHQQARPLTPLGDDLSMMSFVMSFMHEQNKRTLQRLLADEPLKAIRLQGGDL
jgi:hypothetical protein